MTILHNVVGTMEAPLRFPNWILWLLGVVTTMLVIGSAVDVFPWQEGSRNTSAMQPVQQVDTALAELDSVPAMVENSPAKAQTEPKVAAPAAPMVVGHQVTWTEVQGFDPSTIPTEEGIYDASYSWIGKGGYGERILPHLEGLPVAVAATRDEHNTNIVLAALDADHYGPYLMLSVDEEKSWCRLNLIPITWERQVTNGVTPEETRVVVQGEKIHLYGRYALGAGPDHLYWWEAVVTKSELPCS